MSTNWEEWRKHQLELPRSANAMQEKNVHHDQTTKIHKKKREDSVSSQEKQVAYKGIAVSVRYYSSETVKIMNF